MAKIIKIGEMTHKLIDEILDLKSNKARVEKWISLGLNPMKGLSADFTKLMYTLYEDASGDLSMRHRYNCGSCQKTIQRKLEDFARYGDNMGRPLINWIDENEQGISIIIPAYKASEIILDAVWSLVSQDLDIKKEILIGVDGDQDTLDYILLNDVIMEHCRVFWSNYNVGPYLIKNTLTEIAKYNKIIYFDADDIAGPELVKKSFKQLDMWEQVRWYCQDFTENIHQSNKGIVAIGCFATHKLLMLNRNGFQPWRVGADTEYAMRSSRDRIIIDDTIMFYRRVWPGSLTQRPDTGMRSPLRKSIQKDIEKMKRNGFYHPQELNKIELIEYGSKDDKLVYS